MCGGCIRARTPTRSRSSRSSACVSRLPADGVTAAVRLRRRLRLGATDAGAGASSRVAILVRLRADRCFYADPPPAAPSPKGGRPRSHGAKFACKDPATWPAPTAEHCAEDEQYGTVRVRAWAGLHPKQQTHPGRGTRKTRPIVRGTVVLVEVSRLPARPYPPQVLWLWWAGPGDAGPGPALARLRPPLRPGAHAALLQAEPRLDDAAGAAPGASRSLDLAGRGRLHPAAAGTAVGRRPPPALGAAAWIRTS